MRFTFFEIQPIPVQHGLDDQQLFETFKAMEDDTSSFASAIANSWFCADSSNRQRIESAFPELVDAFKPVAALVLPVIPVSQGKDPFPVEYTMTIRSKTTYKTDTVKVQLYRWQRIEEVASNIAASYGATVESCTPDDSVNVLRTALRETFGFIEAWQCHLSDSGSDLAAATVLGMLAHIRSVYELTKPDHIASASGSDKADKTGSDVLTYVPSIAYSDNLIAPSAAAIGDALTDAENMLLLLQRAVTRVELANAEGNPILSAWLPEAKAVISGL